MSVCVCVCMGGCVRMCLGVCVHVLFTGEKVSIVPYLKTYTTAIPAIICLKSLLFLTHRMLGMAYTEVS